MAINIEPFQYRLSGPAVQVYPGAHPGQMVGNGQLFKRHEALIARPDPRRIDLRASLLDPFGQYRVKAHQEHSRVEVMVLADLSASMTFVGRRDKRRTIVEILQAIVESAHVAGDRVGFAGFGAADKPLVFQPPGSIDLGGVERWFEALSRLKLKPGCDGLWRARAYLPARRSLVFLIGDGHWPLVRLPALLASLGRHELVPLLLWDEQEYLTMPDWGLLVWQDLETGRRRRVWMRPALKRRIETAYQQRRRQLQHAFRAFGHEPMFIEQGYRAEQFNQYFLARAA